MVAVVQSAAMAAGTGDRAWDAAAIGELLATPGAFGYLAVEGEEPQPLGFVFCRHVAGEAEILVLAVLPEHWRRGIGRGLLDAALARAAGLGIERILLEVAVDNISARALYDSAGFGSVGRRPAYYRRSDGRQVDAITLERPVLP
ncbi:MAG: GNAT family N-acetyltransferase [Alphaproteobacteria bacterium]